MKYSRLAAIVLALVLMIMPVDTAQAAQSASKQYTTVSKAADLARTKVVKHAKSVSAYIKSTSSDVEAVFEDFLHELIKETPNSDEGDYMRWDINREYPSYTCKTEKKGNTIYYNYHFKIEYLYFTTSEQKNQVDNRVREIIAGFNFTSETTDYDKIKTIYDYVCQNVRYADNVNNDIVYTSWSALFNQEAVCQGYAQLLYKMLKEVGISNRVVPGYGKSTDVMHGWNIVKLGDYYYNIDATWDAELAAAGKEYEYFLKGDNFRYHTRLDDYTTSEFYARYPMAANDYGAETNELSYSSKRAAFNVIKPKFKSVTRKKLKLVKVADAIKYQIKYSTTKKFKQGTKTVSTPKTAYNFKNLKKKNKYYVKFRAYTFIDGKKVYTQWSKTKTIKKKK